MSSLSCVFYKTFSTLFILFCKKARSRTKFFFGENGPVTRLYNYLRGASFNLKKRFRSGQRNRGGFTTTIFITYTPIHLRYRHFGFCNKQTPPRTSKADWDRIIAQGGSNQKSNTPLAKVIIPTPTDFKPEAFMTTCPPTSKGLCFQSMPKREKVSRTKRDTSLLPFLLIFQNSVKL